MTNNDEMDIFELLAKAREIIAQNKYWALLTPAVFLLGGFAAAKLAAPQWEATGVLMMGKLCDGDLSAPCRLDAMPEPYEALPQRASAAAFQAAVLKAGGVDPAGRDSTLYRTSQKLRLMAPPNMVEIKVRAYTREMALKLAAAAAEELRRSNDAAAAGRLASLKDQLARTRKALSGISGGQGEGGARAIALYLCAELGDKAAALEKQLDFAEKNAASVGQLAAATAPVYPKTALWTVCMGLFGVFLGVAIPLFLNFMKLGR